MNALFAMISLYVLVLSFWSFGPHEFGYCFEKSVSTWTCLVGELNVLDMSVGDSS